MLDVPRPESAIEAWSEILGRLEHQLREAESLLNVEGLVVAADWQLPADAPTIPAGLAPRAQAILDAQSALLERLETARVIARRHLQYLDADAAKGLVAGPRFVDQRA